MKEDKARLKEESRRRREAKESKQREKEQRSRSTSEDMVEHFQVQPKGEVSVGELASSQAFRKKNE